MKIIITLFLLPVSQLVAAQASLFQDAKGESALKVFGNSVSVSTKDESINAAVGNYYRTIPAGSVDKFRRWAITVEVKANEGISNFKDGNNYLIDGSAGFYHGWKKVPSAVAAGAGWALERYISGTAGADRNKLVNTSLPAKDMVYSKGQFVYKFEIGQFGFNDNLIYGFNLSYKQQTNIDDIKLKTVHFLDYASPGNTTLLYREKQGYDINEFIGNQHVFSVNGDVALLLNPVSASGAGNVPPQFLAFHFRYQYLLSETSQFNPGVGYYLGRHGAPRTIIGGFNIQLLDLFNAKKEDSNAWDRAAINFVVGFKL